MSETENQQKGTPRRPRINKMPFLVATLFIIVVVLVAFVRSEERRVGKEC